MSGLSFFGGTQLAVPCRVALAVLALTVGCGDDGTPELAEVTTGGSTGVADSSTGVDMSTNSTAPPTTSSSSSSTSSTTDDSESSSSGPSGSSSESSSSGAPCIPGEEGCTCLDDFTCGVDLACRLNTCEACPAGTLSCSCIGGDEKTPGTCEEGLGCNNDICTRPLHCAFTENGTCDEPEGTGLCAETADSFDCCAVEPGVCEEEAAGGACPNGSDAFDCCPTVEDGTCEEFSAGGMCPDGSDAFDCCPTVEDGTCEEMSAGGACPDGSDVFDCCATPNDKVCDEISGGGTCPDGSDPEDCAT